MKRYLLILALGASSLFADLKSISADELLKMQAKGVPVIDIRTATEWKERGVIKGAQKLTFFNEQGKALMPSFMFKLGSLIKDKNKPFIIYCAHANRTKSLGNWLSKSEGFKNVYELKGGIEYGWIDKGKKTVK